MAIRGQVLDEGAETIEFLATAADTGGEYIAMRVTVAPGRPAPPEHVHPNSAETFSVESGLLGYVIGDRRGEAGPGETMTVPANTNHTFFNVGDQTLVFTGELRPALDGERFIESIHVLIRDGGITPGKRPNPFLMAVLGETYKDVWRLSALPAPARALMPLMAWVGRRMGYREFYGDESPARAATAV